MLRKYLRFAAARFRTNYIVWEVAIQLDESINVLNMSQIVVPARFYFKKMIYT